MALTEAQERDLLQLVADFPDFKGAIEEIRERLQSESGKSVTLEQLAELREKLVEMQKKLEAENESRRRQSSESERPELSESDLADRFWRELGF